MNKIVNDCTDFVKPSAAISTEDVAQREPVELSFVADPDVVAACQAYHRKLRETAQQLEGNGIVVLGLHPGSKQPMRAAWQNQQVSQLDFIEQSTMPNIGVILGEASRGLVDVDLDCAEARLVADILLPSTGMIWGRQSAPNSHRGYRVQRAPQSASQAFDDPVHEKRGARLLELRSTGGQTVIPPSRLPSKIDNQPHEDVIWQVQGDPAEVEIDDLRHAVARVAAATLLGRYWPNGARHDAALALAGGMLRAGETDETTLGFMRAVCLAAGDQEIDDRLRAVYGTIDAFDAGEPITGWPRLAELLGDHGNVIVSTLHTWLGHGDDRESLPTNAPNCHSPETSAAGLLVQIGQQAELWHDPTRTGFATIGRRSFPIRSEFFRSLLLAEYMRRSNNKVPSSDAMANAVNALHALAVVTGKQHPVFTRVGCLAEKVYLDLADDAETIIEIDANGWRVCDNPPVRFRRSPYMKPLPMPQCGGSLNDLRMFINVPDDAAFSLLLAWLTAGMRPVGPYPAMVLVGGQGSAKTTTARVLKELIDPSAAPLRSEPREERDLMIHAQNSHVLAFDNISVLPHWLSDAFCRLATGGGIGVRELYSNDSEKIFEAVRPVLMNGIEDFVTRSDLLERSLIIRHPAIPDSQRVQESLFWGAFSAAHPKLLGALLDRVAGGLRELPNTTLARLPRMADFALFAVACERAAGETPRFAAAYAGNQGEGREQALEASPVVPTLLRWLRTMRAALPPNTPLLWQGTATVLLDCLRPHAPNPLPRGWPTQANFLTNILRRIITDLQRVHGIQVRCDVRVGGQRRVAISWPR